MSTSSFQHMWADKAALLLILHKPIPRILLQNPPVQPPLTTVNHHIYFFPMGANSSLLSPDSSDGSNHPSKLKLGDIPESCVALVLSYLDPPEICKLARLNRAFRAASSADFIWDAKLPSNYHHLVDDYLIKNPTKLGKNETYARLSRPVPFDSGNKVRFLWSFFTCTKFNSRLVKIRRDFDAITSSCWFLN